jgi:heme-degrading monooxygenase HmoA
MFCVLFEVQPKPDRWDAYLGYAKILKPELEKIDGFVDNIRYRSLSRQGWLLSLSSWRDEKALVRWRVDPKHHEVQEKGRSNVFMHYHLRVGQLTIDSKPPQGHVLSEQRLDETTVGAGTTVTLIDARRGREQAGAPAAEIAAWLGFVPGAPGLVGWDVFDAVLTPGDVILLLSWRDQAAAQAFERGVGMREGTRLRRIRVIRDYSMFDRREAPQYYAAVAPPACCDS